MSTFDFKQFKIKQDVAAVKVGTDAMLLGCFTPVEKAQYVLEIGTGTGVISLMLAQKNPSICIDALEIEQETAIEAQSNVYHSPFNRQIQVHIIDFLQFQTTQKYDVIVTNPPYFDSGVLPDDEKMRIAKHIDIQVINSWFEKIADLLLVDGECWMIIPFNSLNVWIEIAESHELFLVKQCNLYAKPSVLKRVIVTFSKLKLFSSSENFIIRTDDGFYTECYQLLTKDYHNRVPLR